MKNVDPPGETRFCCRGHFSRAIHLLACWKQCFAVEKSPAIKLHIGQLDSLGLERLRELNHLRQTIDVAPVNNEVEAEGNSCRANFFSDSKLALMRARACNLISEIGFVRLKT